MVGIKGMNIPKGCWYSTNSKMSGITTCPLKSYCSAKHIKEAPLDTRPADCPLIEIEDTPHNNVEILDVQKLNNLFFPKNKQKKKIE